MSWVKDFAEIADLLSYGDGWKVDGSADYIKIINIRIFKEKKK